MKVRLSLLARKSLESEYELIPSFVLSDGLGELLSRLPRGLERVHDVNDLKGALSISVTTTGGDRLTMGATVRARVLESLSSNCRLLGGCIQRKY